MPSVQYLEPSFQIPFLNRIVATQPAYHTLKMSSPSTKNPSNTGENEKEYAFSTYSSTSSNQPLTGGERTKSRSPVQRIKKVLSEFGQSPTAEYDRQQSEQGKAQTDAQRSFSKIENLDYDARERGEKR